MTYYRANSKLTVLYLLLTFLAWTSCATTPDLKGALRKAAILRGAKHQKQHARILQPVMQDGPSSKPLWNNNLSPEISHILHKIQVNAVRVPQLPGVARQSLGFTGDSCLTDSECAGERACLTSQDGDMAQCNGSLSCVCIPRDLNDLNCSCDDPICLEGDVCFEDFDITMCFSLGNEFSPVVCPSPTEIPTESPSVEDGMF